MEVKIVLVTVVCCIEFVLLCKWFIRVSELDDEKMWIEPVIMLVGGLFIYLILK